MTSQWNRHTDELAEALRRAVEGGILGADQAQAVLAAERRRAEAAGGGSGLPVTEALGYLGGLLALSGAVTLAVQYWRDVPVAGRLGLLALVAAASWLVGARIGDGSAPALIRLRGALWFASSAAVAALAGQAAWTSPTPGSPRCGCRPGQRRLCTRGCSGGCGIGRRSTSPAWQACSPQLVARRAWLTGPARSGWRSP